MKKFYTIMAAMALTLTAQARQISFFLGDTPIESGSTIAYNDIEDTGMALQIKPPLYAVSESATQNAKFVVECTTGQTVQCCIGGACVMGSTITKDKISMEAGKKIDMEFEYADYVANSPEDLPTDITVKISGQDGVDPRTKSEFTIILNGKNSTAFVFGDKAEVTVSGKTLAYKVDGASTISLYNILGVKAMQANVSGAGTLSLTDLPRGIYVYTVEGASNLSGKISIP